jgi:LmbE family N-acetylglucosaminyl deacetylase
LQSPIRDEAALPEASRVLAICAHPDDIESWCGGTLALLTERGCTVELAVCTAGEKGSGDRSATVEQVAATRLREQREAADLLGISRVRFLGGRDGELDDNAAFRCQMVRLLREVRPSVVFTHDPEHPYPPYITHRDHRVVGRVVLDAVYPMARDHLYFPEQVREGLEPHAVSQVWLFSSMAATTAVDISSTLDRKIFARLAHRSQTSDPDALRAAWRERAAAIGAPWGLAAVETFVVVDLE